MKDEKIFCGYCNKTFVFDEITNRTIPPYVLSVSSQPDIVFCSAKCGNKYCIDKNIPFRYCSNQNCGQRGAYHQKTYINPPEDVLCGECYKEALVTCESCGKKYFSNCAKAKKSGEPERFCSIKCKKAKKVLTLRFDNKLNKEIR